MKLSLLVLSALCANTIYASEHLLGYVKGAETLPAKSSEVYQIITVRDDKSAGEYKGYNYSAEYEYGVTNSFSTSIALQAQKIDRKDLVVDGYLPEEKNDSLKLSGAELELKYNFLSPAKDDLGLSVAFGIDHSWYDTHSGLSKDTTSIELSLLLQKFFFEGELTWFGNIGMETTYADRNPIDADPELFEWPTKPEMEMELKLGTGLSYRFMPNWYIGGEVLYETEYETEVGQERWSFFSGPSLHYGAQKWWITATWLKQVVGGGEVFDDQEKDLHLIEKTKQEYKVKVGFNF